MATCVFPKNKVLKGMAYADGTLTLDYIKDKGLERRSYADVPLDKAYGLLYKKTASDVLKYYAREIRKQYRLIDISLVR